MSGDAGTGWPAALSGVTETVVTTRGPDGRWNVAALGVIAPDARDDGATSTPSGVRGGDASPSGGPPVVARTWGRTRTRRNFAARGEGYVQFTRDPVDFVEAACSVREEAEPVLSSADAWVRVAVDERDRDDRDGWVEWRLVPVESDVERRVVPTINRAHAAVVEATVAASRLDVPAYDATRLRERIADAAGVVESCAGPRERAAWERFEDLVAWRAGDHGT